MALTQQQVQELFEYRDGDLFWKKRPINLLYRSTIAGYKNTKDSYWRVVIKGTMYLKHRLVFLYHNGYLPKFIDHINGNREDNRIENLRVASRSENNHNATLPCHNTSGIKGVSKKPKEKNWTCSLRTNKKLKTVGGFPTKELAQEFMELWREMAHGQFANHGYQKGVLA
jgi:hypothetical protein